MSQHMDPGTLSFSDLETFLTICECGSLTAAAKKRHSSQPSLSASLKRMETLAGARLFERARAGLKLTPAGTRFREYADVTLQGWRALHTGKPARKYRRLRIGSHPAVASYALPPLLARRAQTENSVSLEFRHGLSRVVREWILNREIDLGFVVNPIPHPDLLIRKVGEDVVTLFAIDGIKGRTLLGDPNLRQTRSILKLLARGGEPEMEFVPCDELEVIKQLVLKGACYGILPTRVAAAPGIPKTPKPMLRAPRMHDEICVVALAESVRTDPDLKAFFQLAKTPLPPLSVI